MQSPYKIVHIRSRTEPEPNAVKKPNATTIAAMKEARALSKPRFGRVKELFDELEKDGATKARKSAKKKR